MTVCFILIPSNKQKGENILKKKYILPDIKIIGIIGSDIICYSNESLFSSDLGPGDEIEW